MNKNTRLLIYCSALLLLAACRQNADNANDNKNDAYEDSISKEEMESSRQLDTVPLGAKALIQSYPDFIEGFEDGYIIYKDGERQVYDDKEEKSFDELLDNSSLKDMFYVAYTQEDSIPGYLQDAGRSRNENIFKKMYGHNPGEVAKSLETIDWFGQKLPFTRVNNASEQLKKVAAELKEYPELRKYLKSGGTYYWRKVRGANRQSAHSYGIAIDVGVDYSDYWLWKNSNAKETDRITYANRMPKKLVEIFKKHGFIWGGAWYHFDTMHFEYRPEILLYAEMSQR